jgi:hypothetical protein
MDVRIATLSSSPASMVVIVKLGTLKSEGDRKVAGKWKCPISRHQLSGLTIRAVIGLRLD